VLDLEQNRLAVSEAHLQSIVVRLHKKEAATPALAGLPGVEKAVEANLEQSVVALKVVDG
jgi:hypothetical protein